MSQENAMILYQGKAIVFSLNVQHTRLPSDTTQLWIQDGLSTSDTTLIICQGGPKKEITYQKRGRTIYRYMPNYKNYKKLFLHQSQTFNPKLYEHRFTYAMAEKEVEVTSEMLKRAIIYEKKRGKTVIVIGHSYGAYIIVNYLSNYTSLANKYIIMAGRIDETPEMFQQHYKGLNGYFLSDGLTFVPEEMPNTKKSEEYRIEFRVKQLLKAAIGKPRYSVRLKDKDLSNVVYIYATNDIAVGRLTSDEILFLKSKNALVYQTSDGHSETIKRFIDYLYEGKIIL